MDVVPLKFQLFPLKQLESGLIEEINASGLGKTQILDSKVSVHAFLSSTINLIFLTPADAYLIPDGLIAFCCELLIAPPKSQVNLVNVEIATEFDVLKLNEFPTKH